MPVVAGVNGVVIRSVILFRGVNEDITGVGGTSGSLTIGDSC